MSTQVIFGGSHGALAGLSGISAVQTRVVGLGDEVVRLEGLPLYGDVRIAMFNGEGI